MIAAFMTTNSGQALIFLLCLMWLIGMVTRPVEQGIKAWRRRRSARYPDHAQALLEHKD